MRANRDYDIVVISLGYNPKSEIGGKLVEQLCSDFSANGLRVAVISQNRSYLNSNVILPGFETVSDVDIYRVKVPMLDKNKRVQKILMFYYFAVIASKLASKLNTKLIMTFLPPYFVSYRCLRFSKRAGARHLLVMYDIHPDTLIKRRALSSKNPIAWLLKRQTRFVIQGSDHVISIGRDMRSYLIEEYGISLDKISYIPNWGSASDTYSSEDQIPITETDEEFLVVYSGNLGEASGIDDLLRAAAIVSKTNSKIVFRIVGSGTRKAQIVSMVSELGVSNIHFSDFLLEKDYRKLLDSASVLVVTLRRESLGMSVPSKLYNYLSFGKPILAIVPENSEVDLAIKEDKFGISCRNGYVADIVNAILELKENSKLRVELSSNSRKAFESKYSREVVTSKYLSIVKELIK